MASDLIYTCFSKGRAWCHHSLNIVQCIFFSMRHRPKFFSPSVFPKLDFGVKVVHSINVFISVGFFVVIFCFPWKTTYFYYNNCTFILRDLYCWNISKSGRIFSKTHSNNIAVFGYFFLFKSCHCTNLYSTTISNFGQNELDVKYLLPQSTMFEVPKTKS